MVRLLRRRAPEPAPVPEPAAKPGGKGRATPTRAQAQAGRRQQLVGASRTVTARSKEDRRSAYRQTLEAHRTEDQRFLPLRDRGPVRRFVRDVVDGRRNIGEYFLPLALVVLVLSALPFPALQLGAAVALYLVIGVLAIDSLLLFRTVKARVRERFGDEAAAERGLGGYAVMRGFQLRRMRRPHTQVRHGQPPR